MRRHPVVCRRNPVFPVARSGGVKSSVASSCFARTPSSWTLPTSALHHSRQQNLASETKSSPFNSPSSLPNMTPKEEIRCPCASTGMHVVHTYLGGGLQTPDVLVDCRAAVAELAAAGETLIQALKRYYLVTGKGRNGYCYELFYSECTYARSCGQCLASTPQKNLHNRTASIPACNRSIYHTVGMIRRLIRDGMILGVCTTLNQPRPYFDLVGPYVGGGALHRRGVCT